MADNPKVALVTGAAQGIGRGISHYLLEKNWRVVLFDIDEAAGQQCLKQLPEGRGATFIAGDVANENDVTRCLEHTLKWGGQLDALINNAGLADPHSGPMEELSLAISLGPDVRVNSISPGWIDVRAQQAGASDNLKSLPPGAHAQHPAGRVGKAEDIGSLVAYLASSEAAFVTGQDFIVDGGMTRKMIYE